MRGGARSAAAASVKPIPGAAPACPGDECGAALRVVNPVLAILGPLAMRTRMRRFFTVIAALSMLAGCAAGPSPFATARSPALHTQLALADGAGPVSPAQLLADRIIAGDGVELPMQVWAPEQAPR